MIFVTVGTQLSFDRLITHVETWALENDYKDIIFQVGERGYKPRVGEVFDFISGRDADEYFNKADVIVGHAGMGTILSCLSEGKPLVVMPRLFSLGEHRNDHQLATYNKLKGLSGLYPADDEKELATEINKALKVKEIQNEFQALAPKEITDYIRGEVIF